MGPLDRGAAGAPRMSAGASELRDLYQPHPDDQLRVTADPGFPVFPESTLSLRGYLDTPHGPCFALERWYPRPQILPEREPLDRMADSRAVARAAGLGWPHQFSWDHTIFLDTETTGLGGGAGTYVFMVGLGWLTAEAFIVRQYCMQALGAERALLHLVLDDLARATGLVSFNGRGFDLPLLSGRLAFSRIRNNLEQIPHLDLLLLARRLYRARLGSCSLGSLERNVLGLQRDRDTQSWLIPSLYFDYLRRGDPSQLAGVFDHNAQDVASLVVLAAAGGQLLAEQMVGPADDLLAVAAMLLAVGEIDGARARLEQVLSRPLALETKGRALYNLAGAYKRLGRWPEAEAVWLRIISERGTLKLPAAIELAKYYEHRLRLPERALQVVERAQAQFTVDLSVTHPSREDLARREARLRQKLNPYLFALAR